MPSEGESPWTKQMSDSKDDYGQMENILQTQGLLALWDEEEMADDDAALLLPLFWLWECNWSRIGSDMLRFR